ncbi:MAG TPA: helix-turn-helix domain-containing protein [Glycomyces sp.]|nr:helix-turn-helix domain-containing protein [Glycomyces sp.]
MPLRADPVAARAGVAIGTVFRHFPTKPDLLKAVVMNLRDHLVDEAEAMVRDQDDAAALFERRALGLLFDGMRPGPA